MKKKELERKLVRLGWHLLRQGRHEVWTNGVEVVAVPRHREISELTARTILRKAQKYAGKGSV